MSKIQEKQYIISISTEDFTYDTKNNIVQTVDSEGKTIAVDTWKYAIYFFENIQRKDISEHSVYLDGLRLDKFIEIFIKDKNHQKICTFLTDDYSCFLYREMQEKYGTYINWVALYGLCAYIREIINRRYALLLKPTLKDTIEEIGGLDNLESVTFNLKNGNKHSTDFCEVKELIVNSLEGSDISTVGFDRIIKKIDVYTKEYGQIEFVRYISKFLHDYFSSVKRRKNSYLTITEQKLVCYLLKFFDFSPEIVTESRFRQLFNSKYNEVDHIMPFNFPGIIETKIKFYLEFIPYSIWSKGKINPLKENKLHKGAFVPNFTMNMGENPDVSPLINLIDGIVGECTIFC